VANPIASLSSKKKVNRKGH